MTSPTDRAWHAGRLIQWALRPHARPAQEGEYQELVGLYFDEPTFRTLVRQMAEGLGLFLLDVSEHGVVVAPQDDSVFAFKAADFRPGASKAEDRLLDGLVQVAIATTIYPHARDLDDDPERSRPPVTVEDIETHLRGLCGKLAEEARGEADPTAENERRGLIEAWRVYHRRLEVLETKDRRDAVRATRRIIRHGLEKLRDFGCFTLVREREEDAWQPTRRYQLLVQQLAATKVHEIVRSVLDHSSAAGEVS